MLTRVLFIIAAIVTTSVASATPVLTLSASPTTYVPGEPLEVTITATSTGADNLSALGFKFWTPPAGQAIITDFSLEGYDNPYYEAYSAEAFWYNLGSIKQATVTILPGETQTGDIVVTGQLSWYEGVINEPFHGGFISVTIPQYVVPPRFHSADTNFHTGGIPDGIITLDELLRVIQFYNMRGYHCDSTGTSEDGYAGGIAGIRGCDPHDTDYSPQDWMIGLDELLRLIQFYNTGGYHNCPDENTEDGFCAGP